LRVKYLLDYFIRCLLTTPLRQSASRRRADLGSRALSRDRLPTSAERLSRIVVAKAGGQPLSSVCSVWSVGNFMVSSVFIRVIRGQMFSSVTFCVVCGHQSLLVLSVLICVIRGQMLFCFGWQSFLLFRAKINYFLACLRIFPQRVFAPFWGLWHSYPPM